MRKDVIWLGAAALLASVSVSGNAAYASAPLRISCPGIAQADFDHAAALMDNDTTAARNAFRELEGKANECAILHWGVAASTADVAEHNAEAADAVYFASVAGANDAEWAAIADLKRR
jgi:hypothetical protein